MECAVWCVRPWKALFRGLSHVSASTTAMLLAGEPVSAHRQPPRCKRCLLHDNTLIRSYTHHRVVADELQCLICDVPTRLTL
jgi:hypothetical protein